jgi:hypothetical protein
MTDQNESPGWEVISIYTRQQAREDGEFIDITAAATEAGFTIPDVIITRNCAATLELFDDDSRALKPDELRQVLEAFYQKVKAEQGTLQDICELAIAGNAVWLHIGSNDTGQPCLTLMLPEDW